MLYLLDKKKSHWNWITETESHSLKLNLNQFQSQSQHSISAPPRLLRWGLELTRFWIIKLSCSACTMHVTCTLHVNHHMVLLPFTYQVCREWWEGQTWCKSVHQVTGEAFYSLSEKRSGGHRGFVGWKPKTPHVPRRPFSHPHKKLPTSPTQK